MENQILQLCQFNDEGKCVIDINKERYETSGVEPVYYENMYADLVKYFKALSVINKNEKLSLETVIRNSQSNRLITLNDFDQGQADKNIFEYKIRRICRLKHPYMLYLYKMYLEHQGRHPFDCMNMSRVQEIQVKLQQDESIRVPIDIILTPDRDLNREHIENMDWYIDVDILEDVVSHMFQSNVEIEKNEQCIGIDEAGKFLKCRLDNGDIKNVHVKKIKDMISIELNDVNKEF